jgi:hypothetical protein
MNLLPIVKFILRSKLYFLRLQVIVYSLSEQHRDYYVERSYFKGSKWSVLIDLINCLGVRSWPKIVTRIQATSVSVGHNSASGVDDFSVCFGEYFAAGCC